MFRNFIAFLLIITVLAANLSRYIICASFDLNRNYIASTLCENKDKPMLNCKGKCYLAKKIKQAEEKERSQEKSQKNRFQEALITQKLKIYYPNTDGVAAIAYETPFDLPQHSSSIFHPPQV
ncbi:MAG: hypothetical protein ACYCZO_02085 [Daejeonella sp.]